MEIVLTQQEIIIQLKIEIEKLKISRNLDSEISSKPPSSDLLTKPEKKTNSEGKRNRKKSPGGQLGHQGKTRKGFGKVDRYELLKAENCSGCGQILDWAKSTKVEKKTVAVLVERRIVRRI